MVQRHIWKDYEEPADNVRYTPSYQELYKRRKETIERVFADAKEKHAMRYTPYRGLVQVSNRVRLKSAAMNLKKLAIRKWRDSHPVLFPSPLSDFYPSTSKEAGVLRKHNTGFFDTLRRSISYAPAQVAV